MTSPTTRDDWLRLPNAAAATDGSFINDLKAMYRRLKDKGVKIDNIMDHGLSIGIYFRDPDGNGLEVSYELLREKRPRQERVSDVVGLGRFRDPGTRRWRRGTPSQHKLRHAHRRWSGNVGSQPRPSRIRFLHPRGIKPPTPHGGFMSLSMHANSDAAS